MNVLLYIYILYVPLVRNTNENVAVLVKRVHIFCAGSPENLKFDWMITDWSKCSQSCGGSGFQVRVCA
jgi:hypothetical protein